MRLFRRRPRHVALLLCFGVNDDFLSHILLPDALRLEVRPVARPADVLAALPRGCRLVVPALNLTEPWRLLPGVAELRAALDSRGIRLLNAGVATQGKRALHARLQRLGLASAAAAPEGEPDEPLLVKSDLNSGALAERSLTAAQRSALGLPAVADHVPRRDAYLRLARRELPPGWFADPQLAIERFIAGREGLSYRLYQAGRHAAITVRRSASPVGRTANSELLATQLLRAGPQGWQGEAGATELPPGLLSAAWRLAQDCGLDLAGLDILVDAAGSPCILDLNVTPYHRLFRDFSRLNAHLRAGLSGD
jgi:hypothetical protein